MLYRSQNYALALSRSSIVSERLLEATGNTNPHNG
jgi:hypothetical protein